MLLSITHDRHTWFDRPNANPLRRWGVGEGMAHPIGDELALLKAVASAPDDDLPRLVYADWLDEHGRHERAEFIRLQIADARPMSGSERKQVQAREAELLDAHRPTWLREVPRWARRWYADRPHCRVEYARGFPERLSVLASLFLQHGPMLLDRTPLVELTLAEVRRVRRGLATCPWLGRVPRLDLSYEALQDEGATALARNRHLCGVRELNLYGCEVGDAGVRALADAGALTRLARLDLGGNNLTLAGVKALRGARFFRPLVELNLAHNPQLRGYEGRIEGWFGDRAKL